MTCFEHQHRTKPYEFALENDQLKKYHDKRGHKINKIMVEEGFKK